jgi:hypothetical protein
MGQADEHQAAEQSDGTTGAMASDARWITPMQGVASMGAGAIHAAAAGVHAEHSTLSRLFVALAAAQILVGLVTLLRGGRAVAAATAVVNGGAVVAWIVTRVSGISWIEGLEQSEAPQFADTVCAALGALAVGAALVTLRGGASRTMRATPTRLALPAISVGALTVAAMMSGATHAHSSEAGPDPQPRRAGRRSGRNDNRPPAQRGAGDDGRPGPRSGRWTRSGQRCLRPDAADRPVRRRRGDARAAGVR